MTQREEHWPDLGHTCVATIPEREGDDGAYWIEWKLYTLYTGTDRDGKPWRGWQREGAISSPDPVDNLAAAEVYAEGSTKWDGCTDWSFSDGARGVCLHACSRDDLVRLGTLLARVHDLAGHMMPERRDFEPNPLPEAP